MGVFWAKLYFSDFASEVLSRNDDKELAEWVRLVARHLLCPPESNIEPFAMKLLGDAAAFSDKQGNRRRNHGSSTDHPRMNHGSSTDEPRIIHGASEPHPSISNSTNTNTLNSSLSLGIGVLPENTEFSSSPREIQNTPLREETGSEEPSNADSLAVFAGLESTITGGEVSKGVQAAKAPRKAIPADLVETIYQAYPKKVGKVKAVESIRKALHKVDGSTLLDAVRRFAGAVEGCDSPEFIPHPTTWFNQGRWNDDPMQWARIGREKKRPKSGYRDPFDISGLGEWAREQRAKSAAEGFTTLEPIV